jgi:hypothetical protein
MLSVPYYVDSRLTDGGEVASNTSRLRSIIYNHYFYTSGSHFFMKLTKPQRLVRLEGLRKLKKFIHLIELRTSDFMTVA